MSFARALGLLGACCATGAMLLGHGPVLAYGEAPDATPFDYYVLSLSWSPTFCASHPGDGAECGHGRGFVAHGLWPQYEGGGGPEHCAGGSVLDPQTIARTQSAMPDEHLIRHEWVVHGTCSGLSPHDYFATLIQAVARLSIPSDFDAGRPRSLTASQVASEFVHSNPKLSSRSIAVRCQGAQLEEVRICLSRDLNPVACGRDVHTKCRQGPLKIEAARAISSAPALRSEGK